MELCKKEQVEEYVIHAEESANFYTSLRFFLLASHWFPRPLGLVLWSVLHMLHVLYMPLMLLAMFSIVFAISVNIDAIILCFVVLMGLIQCLCASLGFVIVWICLLICCHVPRREPGQALAGYILTTGGTLTLLPQTPPTAACLRGLFGKFWQELQELNTAALVNHLILVSIPYWRVNLGNLCREIVPTYDAVVI